MIPTHPVPSDSIKCDFIKKTFNLAPLFQTIWMNSLAAIHPFGFVLQCACASMWFGLCASKIKATIFLSSALLQASFDLTF